MSSDYYGSIAGEIADRGAQDEAAFLEWLNEYTRHEATGTYHDALRDAFSAGAAHGAASVAGYSIVRTDELERLQEMEAEANGRFRIKEIIKPDRDADFYVGWSHVCEQPAWCGTRAEAIAEGCPPSRLRRADETGTSIKDGFGCDWDDKGLIAEQRGFLPRAQIGDYATAYLLGQMDAAWDLLEPFDGETEVRRD